MTVMTSLMILILMTFAAAILESTSLQTSKNIRRADVERSVESVFAEYQKELLEEYDIFGLDGSYETGSYTEDRVLDRMTVFGAIAGRTRSRQSASSVIMRGRNLRIRSAAIWRTYMELI